MEIKIKNRLNLDAKALELVKQVRERFPISQKIAELVVSRGVKDVKEAEEFLCFSKNDLSDPYLLSDLKEVVDRIEKAVKNNEKIVVFGDYDADGICGAYILVKAIREIGGNVTPYIPNRSEGYGLSIYGIDEIIKKINPSLILTCDLGISCKDEVEYIKSKGIDICVSDHHELPENLPNCLKINPKLDAGVYPCTELCGAGVAFKIAEALVPNKFMDYVEYAAIATVADSVPLKGENRLIVRLGLEKMRDNPSLPLKILIEECKISGDITSMTISFVIAPRINASGRMGIAERSLELFLSESPNEIRDLIKKINDDNNLRQKSCEQIFNEGYKIFIKNSNRLACILRNDTWQTGLLGIVASKISEEFMRPTILFSKSEGKFRGSGRSIDGINMFEMLNSMNELFISFGGHSQACGMTIAEENFEEFENRVEKYLKENYQSSDFLPKYCIDIDENEIKPDFGFISDLKILEPYGVGNPRPVFLRREKAIKLNYMNKYPQHLVGSGSHSEILAFSQGKYLDIFKSNFEKTLLIDYQIDKYQGKKTLKGHIKNFFTNVDEKNIDQTKMLNNFLLKSKKEKTIPLSFGGLNEFLSTDRFGVLIVANTKEGYELLKTKIDITNLIVEPNAVALKSNLNRVILMPSNTVNFDKFHTIVFIEDMQTINTSTLTNSKIYSLNFDDYITYQNEANLEIFRTIYKELFSISGTKIENEEILYKIFRKLQISNTLGLFALKVFEELELVSIKNNVINFILGKKVDLERSKIYQRITSAKN